MASALPSLPRADAARISAAPSEVRTHRGHFTAPLKDLGARRTICAGTHCMATQPTDGIDPSQNLSIDAENSAAPAQSGAGKREESLEALIARVYGRAVRGEYAGGPEQNASLAAHALELSELPPAPPPSDALRHFLAFAMRHGRSHVGWYVRYHSTPLQPKHSYLCERCCPKPYEGEECRKRQIFPLQSQEVFDGIECERCRRQGGERRG